MIKNSTGPSWLQSDISLTGGMLHHCQIALGHVYVSERYGISHRISHTIPSMVWHGIGARGVGTISFEKVWDKHWYRISYSMGFYWYHTIVWYNRGISHDTSGG